MMTNPTVSGLDRRDEHVDHVAGDDGAPGVELAEDLEPAGRDAGRARQEVEASNPVLLSQ